jgi:protein-L-isoaspartate(D-aspartate) O-methyltransferase
MESGERYQRQLLEQIHHSPFYGKPPSPATEQAYLDTPRHLFVKRYRSQGWHEVTTDNLEEHLGMIYADAPLILFADEEGNVLSTIGQPGFILQMLDLLQLEPGHWVFELGAGSGWNAAMMGRLVGPEGHVYCVEIIPQVAKTAEENIKAQIITNVSIIEADGGEGYAAEAPYDRAIFTAGTYDLPRPFYWQIKEGGLLLVVVKSEGGGDNLFLLRKVNNHFQSTLSMPCGFVEMTGKYQLANLKPMRLEAMPEWSDLKEHEISRMRFWWGGQGEKTFMWRTLCIRSYLSMTEPNFQAFVADTKDPQPAPELFGLWDKQNRSLVIAKDDYLIVYGSPAAKERLLQAIRQWVELGMPAPASFELGIYPSDVPLTAHEGEWIIRRKESQFLWTLQK